MSAAAESGDEIVVSRSGLRPCGLRRGLRERWRCGEPKADEQRERLHGNPYVALDPCDAPVDPEDMRRVIRAYQDDSSGVVARYDGFVAKFMGDGILANFGFPRAHEDDPERAVRAGLASFCRIGRWDQRKNLI
jgi:hypothetical protein